MTIATVACIGVGNVGRSWATVFARAGLKVMLWDADPEACRRAMPLIGEALLALAATQEEADAALARIVIAGSLSGAVTGAGWVQESAAERPEVKRELFADMDSAASHDAILASSTSAIPGSAFMNGLAGAARCLVAHPVNPPHLIPLVELCGTPETIPATIETARSFMERCGQSPVHLTREIEGFVLNRLQWALLGEALHLVGEGYCSARDIDRVMTEGLARRWSFLGPFAVAHLNASRGVEGYFEVLAEAIGRVQASLRTDFAPVPDLVTRIHADVAEAIPVERIGEAQQGRDAMLLAVSRFLARPGGNGAQ